MEAADSSPCGDEGRTHGYRLEGPLPSEGPGVPAGLLPEEEAFLEYLARAVVQFATLAHADERSA
jgi:hypothetical protein